MKKVICMGLALAMAFSMVACGGSSSSAASSEAGDASSSTAAEGAVKIGGTGPLTGGAAIYGNAAKRGAEIAVEEINALGGLQFDLKYEDDTHDAEKAVNAYNTLKDWGLQVLAGPVTTTPSIAVAAETANDNLFMMTPSASAPAVIESGDNVFQICFTDPTRALPPQIISQKTSSAPRSASSMTPPMPILPVFMRSSRPRPMPRGWRSLPQRPSPLTTSLTCPRRLPSASRPVLIWCSCPSTTMRLPRS